MKAQEPRYVVPCIVCVYVLNVCCFVGACVGGCACGRMLLKYRVDEWQCVCMCFKRLFLFFDICVCVCLCECMKVLVYLHVCVCLCMYKYMHRYNHT